MVAPPDPGASAPTPRVVAIACSDGVERLVYPKHDATLVELLHVLAALHQHVDALLGAAKSDLQVAMRHLEARPLLGSLSLRVFAWILAHPGGWLPYCREDEQPPEPPGWTGALTWHDALAFAAAFYELHREQLTRLWATASVPGEAVPDPASLVSWHAALLRLVAVLGASGVFGSVQERRL